MKRRYFRPLILFASFTFFIGVGNTADIYSGYLEDYSGLEQDPDRPGAMIKLKDNVNLGNYDKIYITPIEIWYHPQSNYRGISPVELKLLTDTFRGILIDELEPEYPVIGMSGQGVLLVRIALTNVKVKKKRQTLLSFDPNKMTRRTEKDKSGQSISLNEAMLEVELLDANTRERLGILIDRAPGTQAVGGKSSWDQLMYTLKFYGQRFRNRLDSYHQRQD